MMSNIVPLLIMVVIGALIIYVPRVIRREQRTIIGAALFFFGLGGLAIGMKLQDLPFLQSDFGAYAWLGVCIGSMLVGMVSLMSSRQ